MIERVAFSGKMGSGKTSACALVSQELMGEVYIFSFANKLKEMAGDLFEINPRSKDKDVRRILQEFGSYMRLIDEDVWVKYLIRIMNEHLGYYGGIQLVDDLRYENEFWGLRKEGFVLVRLDAPPEARFNRMTHNLTWDDFLNASDHPSETDLDKIPADEWDLIIDSSGTIDKMHNCIRVKLLGKEPL